MQFSHDLAGSPKLFAQARASILRKELHKCKGHIEFSSGIEGCAQYGSKWIRHLNLVRKRKGGNRLERRLEPVVSPLSNVRLNLASDMLILPQCRASNWIDSLDAKEIQGGDASGNRRRRSVMLLGSVNDERGHGFQCLAFDDEPDDFGFWLENSF